MLRYMETKKPKRKAKTTGVLLHIPNGDAKRWRTIADRVGASLTSYIWAVVRLHFRDIEEKEAKP